VGGALGRPDPGAEVIETSGTEEAEDDADTADGGTESEDETATGSAVSEWALVQPVSSPQRTTATRPRLIPARA
jgi:hypothetical protein